VNRIDPALRAALAAPGYRETFARAVLHADTTIRRYIWRGYRPKYIGSNEIMVGDKTAKDFVSEALVRLMDGRRRFDASRSLLDNLNSVTDSLISAEKKRADRSGIVDYAEETDHHGDPIDPISTAVEEIALTPDEKLRGDELREDQRRCIEAIKASFNGDDKMQAYLEALSAGFKRSEISEIMEIPAAKVDELRRKLAKYAPKFFGVTSFEDLQRRLHEGK
jgi:DNA-directed RNA polymerase specialized sigma24 family protein